MKKSKQIICVVLILILAFFQNYEMSVSAYSVEYTNATIKAKEQEIAAAKNEKKQLQNNLTNVKNVKEQLEKSKSDLSDYISLLDGQVESVQAKIEELKIKISEKEKQIEETEEELKQAIEVQTNQYEAMKVRIRFLYEKGNNVYVDMMLNAGSFGEALNKAEYIEKLSAYDKKKLDEYVEYSNYVAVCKEVMEEEKSLLDETKTAQEKEEKSLNELIKEKENEIEQVESDIKNKEAAIAEYQAEVAAQNETIKALEAAVAAEKKRLEEEARRYDGGVFTHPCPGYVRVSDDYGERMHPTLGIKKFHNGIDFAAPAGTSILAAYNGKVVAADYSSTMGNYIMIDHGDGIYTIYMHASKLYVKKGQEVSKGAKIAAVGTTGRSTGNHLHFSVRVNGSYVSPWKYIGR